MKKSAWVSMFFSVFMALVPIQNALAWGNFQGGFHPARDGRWAHRDPIVIHRTYVEHTRGGCFGCGVGAAAVAGLVGGAIIGAAIASNPAPPPQTFIVQSAPPVYAQPMPPAYPIGMQVATLPPGCAQMNVNGATLYQCGPTWYQPYFGGNSVYYTVVPAP